MLNEFYRPHFHRGRIEDSPCSTGLQAWIDDYNKHRANHGTYMAGRTPLQVNNELKPRIRQTAP